MRQTQLGTGGPAVSVLGLGTTGLAGAYGAVDRRHATNAVGAAVDLGITFFDTADVYGNGLAEEIIGDAVRGKREGLVIGTKAGIVRSADRSVTRVDGHPEHIVSACDRSLRRLGVDTIDLYYLHRVDRNVPIEETVGAMKDLLNAGKIRALGLSEVSPATLRRANAVHPISAVQMEYSLWERSCESEILPLCLEIGAALVAYCPLGRGFLTGELKVPAKGQDMPAKDPRFEKPNLHKNVRLLHVVRKVAVRHGRTPAEVALAWLLAKRAVIPIPGTTRKTHLEENVAAASLSLDPADVGLLDRSFPREAVHGSRAAPDAMARLEI